MSHNIRQCVRNMSASLPCASNYDARNVRNCLGVLWHYWCNFRAGHGSHPQLLHPVIPRTYLPQTHFVCDNKYVKAHFFSCPLTPPTRQHFPLIPCSLAPPTHVSTTQPDLPSRGTEGRMLKHPVLSSEHLQPPRGCPSCSEGRKVM